MHYQMYETRHIYMVLASCTLLISPLFVLLVPFGVAETIYYQYGVHLVYAPSINYWVYGAGLFLIILGFSILFLLKINKTSIVVAFACLIGSGVLFYGAAKSFVTITDDTITYRGVFATEESKYEWNEVSKVTYYRMSEMDPEASYYEFQFKDGEVLTLKENGKVREVKGLIEYSVMNADGEFKVIEKEEE
ncbi:hypothetical protein MKZ08_07695 [Viridibacillus sp. FSL R5-0477]|uniref:Uncharacterized protein n=1 Tax=Viridibacillus arenosi FSL R5-213 TaxID=1227360 RepID=W4EYV5_9BACL|nr:MULTISPECIES: hypothetical protein [Viridibacillus]ETT85252.1 hypothetical protein C176_11164 [Viridibacillus arenosi FSL R5-213]OMC81023.1 hypothetical protein BK130_17045 [Viridibacillus sp. FSL H8-0123]OMC89319.1 hypothetical protein BK137_17880 [Viridibacillus arenosi]